MEACGFRIVCDHPTKLAPTRAAEKLAPRYRGLSEEDRTTGTSFIQAVKL
jgi:hypothetical protein